ncbi:MAG: site-2 protease family protein [Bacteroidota bacterium]
MQYFILFLIITSLIAIHELGHFWMARFVGIPIQRFSIGFGPKLLSVHHRKTEFRLSLIPLGGFVLPEESSQQRFLEIPIWKRLLFVAGGPLASLGLPVLLFAGMNLVQDGVSVWGLHVQPFIQSFEMGQYFLESLLMIGQEPSQTIGVVGMFWQVGEMQTLVWTSWIMLSALLTLNLGLINLLPIPVLDGGKIMMYLFEWLYPASRKLQAPLTIISSIGIILLMVGLIIKDVVMILDSTLA